jgi:glycosyltransferase involved in cell wall biosynthesis
MHYAKIENIDECELILVHNDATEEELDILSRFIQPNMQVLHILVEREGLYASWNRAAMAASGEYLAIWNVDDIRTPDSLAAQKAALEQSNAAMCYGDFYGTRTYGLFPETLYRYSPYQAFKEEAFKRHIIGCFPMWRKAIHRHIGYFDEQFKLVSDYEFQLRLIRRYSMVKAAPVLGYYLEHAGHKLSSNRRIQHRERTAVELRYRMYDKIMLHVLPFISAYRLKCILNFDRWTALSVYIPVRRAIKPNEIFSLIRMPFFYCHWFVKKGFHRLYTIIFQ